MKKFVLYKHTHFCLVNNQKKKKPVEISENLNDLLNPPACEKSVSSTLVGELIYKEWFYQKLDFWEGKSSITIDYNSG